MRAVTDTLQPLPGVTKIDVNFANRTATCTVEPDKFDTDGAIAKLADAGYNQAKVIPTVK